MKKILISTMFLTNFFCFKAQEIQESHKIYCAPSLEKCLENLFKLKDFLYYDYEVKKEIPEHIYREYNLVIDYTTLSINMVLTKEENPLYITLDEEDINFRK